MTRTFATLAAAAWMVIAAAPAVAAPAADPAGDWVGQMPTAGRVLETGLRVHRTPQGYQATYEGISQGYRNVALTPVRAAPGPSFRATSPYGVYAVRWDPAAGAWKGEWRQNGKVFAFALRRGTIPPPSLIPQLARMPLAIVLAVIVLQAAGIARLLQLRRRRRLKAKPA